MESGFALFHFVRSHFFNGEFLMVNRFAQTGFYPRIKSPEASPEKAPIPCFASNCVVVAGRRRLRQSLQPQSRHECRCNGRNGNYDRRFDRLFSGSAAPGARSIDFNRPLINR